MYADALISRRKQAGQKVAFQHVPGHAGEPGNEGADALAVHGCKLREADTRNWGDLRHKLEKDMKSETVDASVSPSKDPRVGRLAHVIVWADIRRHDT